MAGIREVLLLGLVGVGAYFLYKYWKKDDTCEEGTLRCYEDISQVCEDGKWVPGGEACGAGDLCSLTDADKCIDGLLYECQDVGGTNRWVATSLCEEVPLDYVCTRCATLGCSQSFATELELVNHIEECHYSLASEIYPLHRTYDTYADGRIPTDWRPVSVRYFFCQPYRIRMLSGIADIRTTDDYDGPHTLCLLACAMLCSGCCDNYLRVWYWHPTLGRTLLGQQAMGTKGGDKQFFFDCDVTTDMLEFEMYSRGTLCMTCMDAQFEGIDVSFSIDQTVLGVPKTCYSDQVGWAPFLVRPIDAVREGYKCESHPDVLPEPAFYHEGESQWCLIDGEAKPC